MEIPYKVLGSFLAFCGINGKTIQMLQVCTEVVHCIKISDFEIPFFKGGGGKSQCRVCYEYDRILNRCLAPPVFIVQITRDKYCWPVYRLPNHRF